MTRDTTTGAAFERSMSAGLNRLGIPYETQKDVGEKPGGGRHRVDHLADIIGEGIKRLMSCKTQNSAGTAEEKLTYELVKLEHTRSSNPELYGEYSVLVLDGNGWSEGTRKYIDEAIYAYLPARKNTIVYWSIEECLRNEFPTEWAAAAQQ